VADRDRAVVAIAERVLGIGERGAGEPLRARHLAAAEDRARRFGEAQSKYAAIDDQKASRSSTDQRHSSS